MDLEVLINYFSLSSFRSGQWSSISPLFPICSVCRETLLPLGTAYSICLDIDFVVIYISFQSGRGENQEMMTFQLPELKYQILIFILTRG